MPYRAYHRAMSRLSHRLGRRGTALLLFGLIWTMYGAAGIFTGATVTPPLWREVQPLVYPLGWILTGLTAAVVGLRHRADSDALGFTSISIMPMVYSATFLVGFIGGVIGNPLPGFPSGVFWTVVWGLVVALIGLLAGWPEVVEADTRHPAEVMDEEGM